MISFFGGTFGAGEIILILLLALLLFGAKKLPELARGLGRSLNEFKKGTKEITDELQKVGDDLNEAVEDTDKAVAEEKKDDGPTTA